MTRNGFALTDADEQHRAGVEAGRSVLAEGLDRDALARRIRFDEHMVSSTGSVFAAFHEGRLAVLRGQV